MSASTGFLSQHRDSNVTSQTIEEVLVVGRNAVMRRSVVGELFANNLSAAGIISSEILEAGELEVGDITATGQIISDSMITNTISANTGTFTDLNVSGTATFLLGGMSTTPGSVLTVLDTSGTLGYTMSGGGTVLGGPGAVNTLTKWTAVNTIGDSSITDTGTLVTVANDFVVNSLGVTGVDLTAATDIILTSSTGAVILSAGQTTAGAINITATGGTNGNVVIRSDGTGVNAVDINSSAGGIFISATGGTNGYVVISSSATEEDAVDINSGAGGVSIDGVLSSHFTLDTTNASDQELLLSCTNGGAGNGNVQITASNDIKMTATSYTMDSVPFGTGDNHVLFYNSVSGAVEYNPTPGGGGIAGWTTDPFTGTLTRTTFDTASVTLVQLAERVAALITDLRAYGLLIP